MIYEHFGAKGLRYFVRHKPTNLYSKKGRHSLDAERNKFGWAELKLADSWKSLGKVKMHISFLVSGIIDEKSYKTRKEYMEERKKILEDIEIVEFLCVSNKTIDPHKNLKVPWRFRNETT